MKNLIGAFAPTNRVLGSFKILMLIVLVAIGFTSCKDQSKSEVSPETELIVKTDLHDSQSNFDIGGGKSSDGGLEKPSDTGGRGSQGTTGEFTISDIGGRGTSSDTGQIDSTDDLDDLDTGGRGGKGTSTGGDYNISDIGGGTGGGRGTGTGTGEIDGQAVPRTLTDIGGRQSGDTGNYMSNDIGGGRGTSTGPDVFSKGQYDHLKINWNEFD